MRNGYTAAIFDLDGTLLDTSSGILEATRHTLRQYGHRIPDDAVLRTFIGPPVQDGFARYLSLDAQAAAAYAATFREYYREHSLLRAMPYPGITELLDALREEGLRLAVATYKREDYAVRLLAHFDLVRRLDVIHGADMAGQRSKTDIIRLCLDELDVCRPCRAVMIGDSVHDARGAAEAGVDFVGVTYGFDFESADAVFRAGALACAATPAQIRHCLWGERVR